MKSIFADTSFWIALINPDDGLHEIANRKAKDFENDRLFTSEMVFVEFLNYFSGSGRRMRGRVAGFVTEMKSNSRVRVEKQTSELFDAALEFYKRRLDKEWSLTDCASYLIMHKQGLHWALTHDVHFGQMGFKALLRE